MILLLMFVRLDAGLVSDSGFCLLFCLVTHSIFDEQHWPSLSFCCQEGCSFHVFWAKGRGPTLDWVPKEYQLCDLYHALLVEERWSYPALSAVASAVYNGTVQM